MLFRSRYTGSVVAVHGCPEVCEIFFALAGGFLTTEPPENCIESLIIIKTARAFHLCLSQQVLDIIAMWMEIIAYAKGLEEQKDLPDD